MTKVVCAWCDPEEASKPDVTATICEKHKKEQLELVEKLRKDRENDRRTNS